MTMTATARQESAEMVDLFTTYTANPDSIGSILTRAEYRKRYQDPLIGVFEVNRGRGYGWLLRVR